MSFLFQANLAIDGSKMEHRAVGIQGVFFIMVHTYLMIMIFISLK